MMLIFCFNLFLKEAKYELVNIDGDLTSISEPKVKGFREYVKLVANELQISGTIKRIPTTRAETKIFGTANDIKSFEARLNTMVACKLIEYWNRDCLSQIPFLPDQKIFTILKSTSIKARKGQYSDADLDGISVPSSSKTLV